MKPRPVDIRFGHDPKLFEALSVIKRQLKKGINSNVPTKVADQRQ